MNQQINEIEVRLERLAVKSLPHSAARILRLFSLYPRYWAQSYAARQGYKKFGNQYPNNAIFVAGLPKSGTTWLEQVLASHNGFSAVYLPEIFLDELKYGDRFDIELPPDIFTRFEKSLVVIKTHVNGLPWNIDLLRKAGVRYAVVYRDLRDVAVSAFFFIRSRPWHPDFRSYCDLTVKEGLKVFAERKLEAFSSWIREWRRNRDPQASIEVRYEDMLENPAQAFTTVLRHFQFEAGADSVNVLAGKFRRQPPLAPVTDGQSVQQEIVHFRKGIKGDWRNYMDGDLKALYKEKIGDLLIELNYERDVLW